jgi:membrane protease YdiL (CAAX protease family)
MLLSNESKASAMGKCVLIFLLSIIVWHSYRFTVDFSLFKSYLLWGTLQGYLFYLVFYILMFAILVFFVHYIDHSSLKDIGFYKGANWKKHVTLGIVFAFSARLLEICLGALVGGVIIVYAYPSLFVVMFFVVDTFFVGLSEESVFRGYIQRKLTDAWRFLPALLFTSILFKIYHIDFFTASMSDIVLTALAVFPGFGIFAGYLYYKSHRNMLGPIALHMFYDLFGTIVPFGIYMTEVNRILAGVSSILVWSTLIIVLKLLSDKKGILLKRAESVHP